MIPFAWNGLRRNLNLVLLLLAATCLSAALGKVIRGATWSLLVPVSLASVLCGWKIGSSRLAPKQAWASLIALGIAVELLFIAGLVTPLMRFLLEALALVPQIILWVSERAALETGPFTAAWGDLTGHAGSVLARFWIWLAALVRGNSLIDPVAVMLAWNLLLWHIGAWSGWRLRRSRDALSALLPGAALLASVIDYTGGEISLVIVYLAILLTLMGIARNQWMQMRWQQRKVDYSDSIVFETLLMTGMVTIGLVLSAAGTPSLSWRELLDTLRKEDRAVGEQVAESLGLEAPPNAAYEPAYLTDGLPRQHLLSMPPELLKDVVLVIRTGELAPVPEETIEVHPERYYWRAITYDIYIGRGWRSSTARDSEVPANTLLMELPPDYRLLTQHIERAPDENAYVFWTGTLARADADITIAWRVAPPEHPTPLFHGDMLGALTGPDEYSVISYIPKTDVARLRAAGNDYPSAITRRYLRLPETVPERVLGLAREITQAALTPYDRAVAIETYLRRFPYMLDVEPPPSGRDVVDYFLFTARQGYCDYYASAMVVLARAAGLPARMVVGYTSGEYDRVTARYIIRKENAHSWAEVYFSGYGWVEFEPTAGQPAIERLDGDLAAGPPPSLPAGERALSWLKSRWRGLVASLAGQVLLAGTAFVLLLFLWQMGEIGFLFLIPAPRAIRRIYGRMEKAASALLPDLPGGHTPHQLQAALIQRLKGIQNQFLKTILFPIDREIERVVALYEAQVFSAHPLSKSQTGRGIHAWSRLRWRLWVAKTWTWYRACKSQ